MIPWRFQEWWNFGILNSKSNSRLKIEWKKFPIPWNSQKIGNFQENFRIPNNSWKIPEMMEFWNSGLKIKFLDNNWVGKTPYTLKLANTSQIQGIPGFLDVWIPGLKDLEMLFCHFIAKLISLLSFELRAAKLHLLKKLVKRCLKNEQNLGTFIYFSA